MSAVETKWSDAHANLDNTFNLKKSNATAKAEIPERKEDEQIKPDHLEIESKVPNQIPAST